MTTEPTETPVEKTELEEYIEYVQGVFQKANEVNLIMLGLILDLKKEIIDLKEKEND